MNDLIKQLNKIEIKPDQDWKQDSRDFLISKIRRVDGIRNNHGLSGFWARAVNIWSRMFIVPRIAWKPVGVFALVALIFFGGSAVLVQASKSSVVGEPLFVVKVAVESLKMAAETDNIRKVALANKVLDSRLSEFDRVFTASNDGSAVSNSQDNNANDEVALALDEVEKNIFKVSYRFTDLKNDNYEDDKRMVAAAMEVNKQMKSYKQKLKKAQAEAKAGEVVEKIEQVLARVDEVDIDVLEVIVDSHSKNEDLVDKNELNSIFNERLVEIGVEAEQVAQVVDFKSDQLSGDILEKTEKVKQNIKIANEALQKGEYGLVLSLANDTSELLRLVYGENFDVYKLEFTSSKEEQDMATDTESGDDEAGVESSDNNVEDEIETNINELGEIKGDTDENFLPTSGNIDFNEKLIQIDEVVIEDNENNQNTGPGTDDSNGDEGDGEVLSEPEQVKEFEVGIN